MTLSRRLTLALPLLAAPARAQTFPDRPVRLIVPFPPGGPVDTAARILAAALPEALRQPVVVENRSGAGGVVGTEAAARAAPDGHTLGFCSTGSVAVSVSLVPNLSYDPRRDFAPVTIVSGVPSMLVVRPGLAPRTLAEFLALARQRPGGITYASTGPGGTPHLAMELLKLRAGVDITHVSYRGAAPVLTALAAGEVDCAFLDVAVLLPHVRDGRLRPLGVTAERRSEAAPDIPTIAEGGVGGVLVENWYAVLAPAATPADRVVILQAAFSATMARPDVAPRFTE
ncbi:MAG TPA: tripartite tricarboxylate transporter substrate binding protein, partial [Acetobacteraceae bacterium]|nr:tripartite tricarboxylate transporter substrate binding protein [Acetobacteraceae bacterium]